MDINQACQILGVHPNDPDLEGSARRSYRLLSKEHHPDKTGNDDHEQFAQINNAYSVVKDFLKNPFIGQPTVMPNGFTGFTINIGGINVNAQAGQVIHHTIDEHGNVDIVIQSGS